jgi:hypothetical protein
VLACIEAIERVMSVAEPIAIDELGMIVDEYLRNLSMAGPAGHRRSVREVDPRHQWRAETCVRVAIPPEDSFDELPTELTDLVDPSDRKFVAVAVAHGEATILEATEASGGAGGSSFPHRSGGRVRLSRPDCGAAREEDG